MTDQTLTAEEAARYLRVHVRTVHRWCREGRLPTIRAGSRYRLRLADLQTMDPTDPKPTRASQGVTNARPLVNRRATVLAIANQKGGVGKTTTTQALGVALADLGARVLLIDADPQASLTHTLGFTPADLSPTLADLVDQYLANGQVPDCTPAMIAIDERIALLPSNLRLTKCEAHLLGGERREFVFREVFGRLRANFDWILIDCPPSLSLLTVNALTFADEIVLPMQPEPMVTAMLKPFLDTVRGIRRQGMNPALRVAGVVLTRCDSRLTLDREVIATLKTSLGESIPIIGEVRGSVRIREATALRVPIVHYKPARDVTAEYRHIAEVLNGARQGAN